MPQAKRDDSKLSVTALRDRFCNPQLQVLNVVKLDNLKCDSKIDNPENFLVTLQAKAMKAYPDPTLPAVAPVDAYAANAAAEQTRFDQDPAGCAELIRSAQEAPSIQIREQFIKKLAWMATWLVA